MNLDQPIDYWPYYYGPGVQIPNLQIEEEETVSPTNISDLMSLATFLIFTIILSIVIIVLYRKR